MVLIVSKFQALGSTVCLLVPSMRELTVEFYRQLDASLGPLATTMSTDLLDVFGKQQQSGGSSGSGTAGPGETPASQVRMMTTGISAIHTYFI